MKHRNLNPAMSFSFWPSLTDVCLIMLLVLILLIFVQIIANTETFKLQKIREKQEQIERYIKESVGKEALNDISFSAQFEIQRIKFSDRVLFNKGSAKLENKGKLLLTQVGQVLKEYGKLYREIRIEGHTDKDPIHSKLYPSNWELSSARATAVVKFFDVDVGIDPENGRLSSVGFSRYLPIDPGDTEKAKSKNRRIEMAIYYDAD